MKTIKQGKNYIYQTPAGFFAGYTSGEVDGFTQAKEMYSPHAYMKQVHGARVIEEAREAEQEADGIFSSKKGLYLFVKTADCLPLLFLSEEKQVIGAVHMGWRSAGANILNNIPFKLKSFHVIAGPGIRKCCYELGKDVYNNERLKPYCEMDGEKAHFDPISFARDVLTRKGLKEENFLDLGVCTMCSSEDLPSFRKDKTEKRTVSFICRR